MPDIIHDLYQNQVYPPMSHPMSDPAMSAVAALLAGLEVAAPRRARILEIGCCSGHNLIPLAMRWPESTFVGIDLAERSVEEARERAASAGVGNVSFLAADLTTFEPEGGPFDFIIAHGFFSWVPDEVKAALFTFCRKHLAAAGIATISFNLESGWRARWPVIAKVKAIQQARGEDVISSLLLLKSVLEQGDPEIALIDDMLAKGPAILAFDDFGPVNDAWPLDRFARAAANAGLRWLCESDPGTNILPGMDAALVEELRAAHGNPLDFQMALDEAAGRTFRSGVLCRDDAVRQRLPLERMLDVSICMASERRLSGGGKKFEDAIRSFSPACVPVLEVMTRFTDWDLIQVVGATCDRITKGFVRPRIEPLRYDPEPPTFPKLDPFRLLCAREGLPLVDAWHKPCAFPAGHYQVLAAMDGSRSIAELAAFSKTHCPELAFDPWLRHLGGRGMFA